MSEMRSPATMTDAELQRLAWEEYSAGLRFNDRVALDSTVEVNENFFIGKQWEGVESNGLPTPVFNVLKRATLHCVANITSDNIKLKASLLSTAVNRDSKRRQVEMVNAEFARLFEKNNIVQLLREYARNACVDGDGCTYTYFDADMDAGEGQKGGIVTEIISNRRVFFGNTAERNVQKQPYIIISRRDMTDELREYARDHGVEDVSSIKPDSDDVRSRINTGDDCTKSTVLLRLWKDRETKTVHAAEFTRDAIVRRRWDTGLRRYPITWMNWDYVQDCYHGEAMITGLIPNQVFINKAFAMVMISVMQTAFPKVVYDSTRIPKWTNQIGAAIGVKGGSVSEVARILDPAQVSPQISQFIQMTIEYTQSLLGATSAALGDTRPDNTSAIMALQRASAIPLEITKQNLHMSAEELGQIYLDHMSTYYGRRPVDMPARDVYPTEMLSAMGIDPDELVPAQFDFSTLKDIPMSLKLDVGASSYWSEIAAIQTLDNALMLGAISPLQYFERIPDGYIPDKQALVKELREALQPAEQPAMPAGAVVPQRTKQSTEITELRRAAANAAR